MYCWNKTFRACENLQKLKQGLMKKVTLRIPDFISNLLNNFNYTMLFSGKLKKYVVMLL